MTDYRPHEEPFRDYVSEPLAVQDSASRRLDDQSLSETGFSDSRMSKQITAARATLDQALARALEKYDGSSDGGREGVRLALAAASEFIQAIAPASGKRYDRFHMILIAALCDLDRGVTSPLLKKKSKYGREDNSFAHHKIRERAAATIGGLMDTGVLRNDAAKMVYQTLERSGFRATKRAVLKWYDELLSGDLKRRVGRRGGRPLGPAEQFRKRIDEEIVDRGSRITYVEGVQRLTADTARDEGTSLARLQKKLLEELSAITRLWHPAPGKRRDPARSTRLLPPKTE